MRHWLILTILLTLMTNMQAQTAGKPLFTLSQFILEDTSGRAFSLDSFKGKTVYVDAWFPACNPCVEQIPYAKLLQQRLQTMQIDTNIVFVTICFRQSKQEWLDALQEHKQTNAIHLYAPAGKYEGAFIVYGFPTYRVFNSKGELEKDEVYRPSTLGKVDFVLYAVSKGMTVKEAKTLEEHNKQANFTTDDIAKLSTPIQRSFFEKFNPHIVQFWNDYDAIKKNKKR